MCLVQNGMRLQIPCVPNISELPHQEARFPSPFALSFGGVEPNPLNAGECDCVTEIRTRQHGSENRLLVRQW